LKKYNFKRQRVDDFHFYLEKWYDNNDFNIRR
jgi:hypothetical protein